MGTCGNRRNVDGVKETMNAIVDVDAALGGQYLITEQRTMYRIGQSLEAVGCDVTYSPYSALSSLKSADLVVWHNKDILPFVCDLEGFDKCINLLYSNGAVVADGVDGILYSQKAAQESSAHEHNLLLKGPFEPQYEIATSPDDYILISGGLYPHRNLHLPLLAVMVAGCNIPVRIVYQPKKDFDWGNRDPYKRFYKAFEFYLDLVQDAGVTVIEQNAVSPVEFEDILRHAKLYIFTEASTCNALVCLESLIYGVPLIAPPPPVIDYTDLYHMYPRFHDWHSACDIGDMLTEVLADYNDVKKHAINVAESLRCEFTLEYNGKNILEIYDRICC